MFVQPLLVQEASGTKLQTVRGRAAERGARIAIYTADMSRPATTRRIVRQYA